MRDLRHPGNDSRVPEAEVQIANVKAVKTRSGNTRFVVVDGMGREYSTFKEQVAAKLPGLEGKRARIKFHEQERDGFTNVSTASNSSRKTSQPLPATRTRRHGRRRWKRRPTF